jgi:hypothetical protein
MSFESYLYSMTQEEFDQKFHELFSGMVQLAFEFVDNNEEEVDTIYIYVSMEESSDFYNVYYKINNTLTKIHEVNKVSKKQYDTSMKRMMGVLRNGTGDTGKTRKLFEAFKHEVPTQMKMKYHPKTGKFDNDISYDLHYSNDPDKTTSDVFDEWFDGLKEL